jgi:hypothetical protein
MTRRLRDVAFPGRRSRSDSTPHLKVPQQLTVKGQSPSRGGGGGGGGGVGAQGVFSLACAKRRRAPPLPTPARCLPIEIVNDEIVNEKETDLMATYRAPRSGKEVVIWA